LSVLADDARPLLGELVQRAQTYCGRPIGRKLPTKPPPKKSQWASWKAPRPSERLASFTNRGRTMAWRVMNCGMSFGVVIGWQTEASRRPPARRS